MIYRLYWQLFEIFTGKKLIEKAIYHNIFSDIDTVSHEATNRLTIEWCWDNLERMSECHSDI